jgi:hypothetical protein
VRLSHARWTIVPMLRVSVGLSVEFFGDTRLRLTGGCDLDLAGSFYFLGHGEGEREAVLDPWTIRPGIAVGVVR